MSRVVRTAFLALVIAFALLPQHATAQSLRTAGDLEGFRARLTAYMRQLAVLQPSRVPPDVIDSIARLNSRELEILQNAFPSNDRFWSTPTALADFLVQSGMSVPSAGAQVVTETAIPGMAQSLSTDWKKQSTGNPASPPGSGLSAQISDRVSIRGLFVNLIEYTDADDVHIRFYPNGTSDEMLIILESPTSRHLEQRGIQLEVTTGFTDILNEDDLQKLRK